MTRRLKPRAITSPDVLLLGLPGKRRPGERTKLTPACTRVAKLLVRGFSTREISRSLGIAHGTARVHIAEVLRAYEVASRFQLIARHLTDGSACLLVQLARREKEVARLARFGMSDKEIAAICGRAVGTVKNQLRSARRKLGVVSRADLMYLIAATSTR